MDATRFDNVAKNLALGISRRRMLRGLAGGLVAFVAGSQVARVADANQICRGSGLFDIRLCSSDFNCPSGEFCSHAATPIPNQADAICCPTGTHFCPVECSCIANNVRCAQPHGPCTTPGSKYCDGTCVDAASDRNNCGYCGNVCRVGNNCSNGHCCPKGTIFCNGSCVPPLSCS